jgi:hypothetical protein
MRRSLPSFSFDVKLPHVVVFPLDVKILVFERSPMYPDHDLHRMMAAERLLLLRSA